MAIVCPVSKKSRQPTLDFTRGLSVFLMILAHALFFFHDGSSPWLNALQRTGNTLCFVMFLFVSGAAMYYAYLAKPQSAGQIAKRVAKRVWQIASGYYLLAILASVRDLDFFDLPGLASSLGRIFLFLDLPGFTEFLVPFIFYTLSMLFLRGLYEKSSRSFWLTLELSYAVYLLAYVLYPVSLGPGLREIKALFVGEAGLNRFPVLSYAPVLLFGMYWGCYLKEQESEKKQDLAALGLSLIHI